MPNPRDGTSYSTERRIADLRPAETNLVIWYVNSDGKLWSEPVIGYAKIEQRNHEIEWKNGRVVKQENVVEEDWFLIGWEAVSWRTDAVSIDPAHGDFEGDGPPGFKPLGLQHNESEYTEVAKQYATEIERFVARHKAPTE